MLEGKLVSIGQIQFLVPTWFLGKKADEILSVDKGLRGWSEF